MELLAIQLRQICIFGGNFGNFGSRVAWPSPDVPQLSIAMGKNAENFSKIGKFAVLRPVEDDEIQENCGEVFLRFLDEKFCYKTERFLEYLRAYLRGAALLENCQDTLNYLGMECRFVASSGRATTTTKTLAGLAGKCLEDVKLLKIGENTKISVIFGTDIDWNLPKFADIGGCETAKKELKTHLLGPLKCGRNGAEIRNGSVLLFGLSGQ